MRRAAWLVLAMIAALPSYPVVAQPIPPQERLLKPRTVFSPTRRFMISGLPPAEGITLGRWAEDETERIHYVVGPVPFERGQFVEVVVDVSGESGLTIEAVQSCVDNEVRQVLMVRRLTEDSMEAAEERLAGLLLNRFVLARQPFAVRCTAPARVPDWLSVGLAHQTNPDLRRRDLALGMKRWARDELSSIDEVMAQSHMPLGRWARKADAALLMNWIVATPNGVQTLHEHLRRLAEGNTLTPAEWRERLTGQADAALAAQEWDLWIAHLQGRQREIGAGSVASVLRLRELALEDIAAVSGPPEWAGASIVQLIGARKESWVRQLAVRLAVRFRLETLGIEPEGQQMAERYARFLDALAGRPRLASEARLQELWSEAEESRIALETLLESRRLYLEQLEDRLDPDAAKGDAPASVRQFLDDIEQRLPAP